MKDAGGLRVLVFVLVLATTSATCRKHAQPSVAIAVERTQAPRSDPGNTPGPKGPQPPSEAATPDGARIREILVRAGELLAALDGRELTPAQQLNSQSADSFTLQARRALEEGDLERASVLSDKALTLLEAVVGETRSEPE